MFQRHHTVEVIAFPYASDPDDVEAVAANNVCIRRRTRLALIGIAVLRLVASAGIAGGIGFLLHAWL